MEILYAILAIIFAVLVVALFFRPTPKFTVAVEDTPVVGTRANDFGKATYLREPAARDEPRFRKPPPPQSDSGGSCGGGD